MVWTWFVPLIHHLGRRNLNKKCMLLFFSFSSGFNQQQGRQGFDMFESTTPSISPPSNPILILGGGVFTKRTEILDISGDKCSAKIPKINRNVRSLGSANLQSVFDTLVLCNIRLGGPDRLCMGAKKSSNSWVVLPPKLPPFQSSGASAV